MRARNIPLAAVAVAVALMLASMGLTGCEQRKMSATQQQAAEWLVKTLNQRSVVHTTDIQLGVRDDWTVYRDGLVTANEGSGRPVLYADAPAEPPNMDPTRDPKNGPFYFTAKVEGSRTRAAFAVWRDTGTSPWQYVSGPGGP